MRHGNETGFKNTLMVERVNMPFDTARYEYHWPQGRDEVLIDWRILAEHSGLYPNEGDVVQIGPLRVMVIRKEASKSAFACRLDGRKARAAYRLHRLTVQMQDIYVRFLLTLYVWKLADCPEWSVTPISWRDIKAVKWLRSKGGKDAVMDR
jgi:hypothetical protein